MTTQPLRSYTRLAVAIVVAGVIVGAALFASSYLAPTKTTTLKTTTTETTPSTLTKTYTTTTVSTSTSTVTETATISSSPATSTIHVFAPLTPVPLYHEWCVATAGAGDACEEPVSHSTSTVGTLQMFNTFNMTVLTGSVEARVDYVHFFGARLNQSGSLQFSVGDVNTVRFVIYFDGSAGASTNALANDVAQDRPEVLVNQSFGVQYFSGEVSAHQAGLYIFAFSLQGLQAGSSVASFLVRDAASYGNGISINIGDRADDYANGTYGSVPRGLEKWSVTVYSNVTTDVNMSTALVPLNVWAKFVPSYLPDVGPNGANTTLLIAGAIKPFVPNQYNISIFMDAVGSNGLEGQTFLPVEPLLPLQILHNAGPISSQNVVNPATEDLTIGQTGVVTYGVVYDPTNSSASQSLSVSMRIAGVIENGSVQPLPTVLTVNQPEPTFELVADEPYYFGFNVTVASSASPAFYTLVLNETIDGQSFMGNVIVLVTYPINA